MSTALWLAAGAIAFGDMWLTAICIRQQVVLGGVAGIAGSHYLHSPPHAA